MEACPQTPSQSVLDHGRSVLQVFRTLLDHLDRGTPIPSWWRIPAWAYSPGLRQLLAAPAIMDAYITYHDCGKPFTRVVDGQGRHHFPGHAAASEAVWRAIGGDPRAARLMGMDMDAHLLKPDGVEEFSAHPEAPSLLLTAIAEVHSNAEMFGGEQSDSFKMKAKHLDRRGKQVVEAMRRRGALPAATVAPEAPSS